MDEKPALTNEEKGKAVIRLTVTTFGIEGAAAVILVVVPLFVMGMDNYANGMPRTVLPFVGVGAINFAYFHFKLKKINES